MRYSVIVCDGLLECRELEDVDDWSKDLMVHNICIRADFYNSWFDVVTWSRKPVSTVENSTTLGLDLLESLNVFIDTLLAVHWAHESVRCHRVSNDYVSVRLDHSCDESIVNGLVQIDSPQGGTPLTTCSHSCKD